jgi:hypothetical protein
LLQLITLFDTHTTHTHTHTYSKTPLGEGSARRKTLFLTTHNTHNRQISMPPERGVILIFRIRLAGMKKGTQVCGINSLKDIISILLAHWLVYIKLRVIIKFCSMPTQFSCVFLLVKCPATVTVHNTNRVIPKKFQQDDTLVQYFIISCKSLYMFRVKHSTIIRSSIKLYLQHLVLTNRAWPAVVVDEFRLTGHRLFVNTRCCKYSLIELLMMVESFTRNMYVQRLAGNNKILYKSVILLEFFWEFIHDARNDEHKKTNRVVFLKQSHGLLRAVISTSNASYSSL